MTDHTTWAPGTARERIASLEARVGKLEQAVRELEKDTPYARQMQRELDETLASNAADGYGEWGPE